MTTPVVVLTDHLNGATGTLTIEEGHCCHFQCISASTLGGGEWVQAKVEWSIDETSEPYNSGMRGFNFSHYCPTAGTYTVTCTVTNVNGETGTAQCVVTVSASTRTTINVNEGDDLYTVWNANQGANKEFVLTGNVTISNTVTLGTNNVIRSSVRGTQRDVTLTGVDKRFFTFGDNTDMTCVDLHTNSSVGSTMGHLYYTNGVNANVIHCASGRGVIRGACLHTEADPRGVLVQDCDFAAHDYNHVLWFGPNQGEGIFSDRLLSVYGGVFILEPTGLERVMRGHARYVSIYGTVLQHEPNAKEPISLMELEYFYGHRMDIHNASDSGSGSVMLIGHTSGTDTATHVVLDSCKLRFSNKPNGTMRIGPNTSSVGKVALRNNVFIDVQVRVEKAEAAWFFHNTFINIRNSGTEGRCFRIYNIEQVTVNKFVGNLMLWSSDPDYAWNINTITNTAFELLAFENNVSGTPSTGFDVTITDTVNGNKTETHTTFNARPNASGNLRKTVTVDGNYRPTNVDDADLLIVPDSDMTMFAEDYYGNARVNSAWLVGAVDVNPNLYYSIAFGASSLMLKTVGG